MNRNFRHFHTKINLQVDLMKIVNIFAHRLFSFQYDENENEYRKLLRLWDDIEYLYNFLKANENDWPLGYDIQSLATKIMDDAEFIDDTLLDIIESPDKKLEHFFKTLDNNEYQFKLLSLQKGRKSYLRLYAIRIDEDTFVITGGAIKFHHLMEDREHTRIELQKLNKAKDYLKNKQIFDEESFFEFLTEQDYD